MNRYLRLLSARLFRDWIGLKTWIWTCALAAWVGPFVNLVAVWTSNSPSTKITNLLASLYNENWSGYILVVQGRMMSLGRQSVPIHIHGLPTCSLWMMASALFVTSAVGGFDTEATLYQSFSEPVSRQLWILEKFVFSILVVTAIAVVRFAILCVTLGDAPHIVPFVSLVQSLVVNWAIGIVIVAITLLASMLVQNLVIVSMVSFVFLSLPLAIGAIVGSFNNILSRLGPKMYWLEHSVLLPLSPFYYGHYNINIHWQRGETMQVIETEIYHLLVILLGGIVVNILAFFATLHLARTADGVSFSSLVRSRRASHALAISGGLLFGCVAAQIIMAGEKVMWLPMSAIGYGGLIFLFWLQTRKFTQTWQRRNWLSGRRS